MDQATVCPELFANSRNLAKNFKIPIVRATTAKNRSFVSHKKNRLESQALD
ncbi:hypothetical protein LQV63_20495 [Paenibacillus profundus]|uniref:Uncharacterized protein n=1 Tax=Paenibacillus profundus TaxID=1173085 RepID=A0ABS8YMK4_9BACL|nr:hypothetical protein [Paenibacillus profundus]